MARAERAILVLVAIGAFAEDLVSTHLLALRIEVAAVGSVIRAYRFLHSSSLMHVAMKSLFRSAPSSPSTEISSYRPAAVGLASSGMQTKKVISRTGRLRNCPPFFLVTFGAFWAVSVTLEAFNSVKGPGIPRVSRATEAMLVGLLTVLGATWATGVFAA
jgi:hypothetical protein